MKHNIILIGFMGVGKGTVARALVAESDFVAIDTDDVIESMENRKIKEIFEQEGEPYFRALEHKVSLWLEKSVKGTIISTGGGFYKQKNIKKIAKVIYLKSSYEGIMERILSHENAEAKLLKRPLLSDKVKAKELFKVRKKEYKKLADLTVDVENKEIDIITKEIMEYIDANN